jgi:hypothetical protein
LAFFSSLTGRICYWVGSRPRTRARLNAAAARAASPAIPATAATREATAGFVSTRRNQRWSPRRPPWSEARRRARGRNREEAAVGAARRSPAAETGGSNVFTWLWRSSGRRGGVSGAATTAIGLAAERGGARVRRQRRRRSGAGGAGRRRRRDPGGRVAGTCVGTRGAAARSSGGRGGGAAVRRGRGCGADAGAAETNPAGPDEQ